MRVLLVSTYELGHQPLGLAAPAAALRARGHDVSCLDLAVETPDVAAFGSARLIAISVPMHTAARLGIALARRLRRLNPQAHICFYGLYAAPLRALLLESGVADVAIGGEYEPALCALADQLDAGERAAGPGIDAPAFPRQRYPVPDRRDLPPLERYARARTQSGQRLAGYVEASRGCAHSCRHCPLTPVYGGRLRLVQAETVLADIDNLVALGAEHITFGDPDFFNAVPQARALLEALHSRHPSLSFDVTIKVEHLLEQRSLLPRLRELGCLFITSAFESVNDEVLAYLGKGHSRGDMEQVLGLARAAGVIIRPTWVTFTPWGRVEDVLAMLEFVEQQGLVGHVQPLQYALRLLLPPGSPLIDLLRRQGLLREFDREGLTFGWHNPDARIEPLQRQIAAIVEHDVATQPSEPVAEAATFARVKQAVLAALGAPAAPVVPPPQPAGVVPGLTEAWFC